MTIKNKLITFIYSLALYLGICLFPYNRFFEENVSNIIKIILLIIYFIFLLVDGKVIKKIEFKRNYIYFIPLIIGTISNYFSLMFVSFEVNEIADYSIFIEKIFITMFIALCEEILFRYLAFDLFLTIFDKKKYGLIYTILITSFIFSLIHLINAFSLDIGRVLVQVLYTFALGLILGILKGISSYMIFSFVGHLVFNVLNGEVFEALFLLEDSLVYYIVNLIVGFIVIAYAIILLYHFKLKGEQHAT